MAYTDHIDVIEIGLWAGLVHSNTYSVILVHAL